MVKTKETYAVQAGDYVGQMFIVCKIYNESVGCLSVPDMKNIKIPNEKWQIGRNSNIIEYVETLPDEVYTVSETQYFANEDINN